MVRDTEITLSLLNVYYEAFQNAFKSWNPVIVFKEFYEHTKPVTCSAGPYLCHLLVKMCTNRPAKTFNKMSFLLHPMLMALRNCEYYVVLSLCGSELGRQVIFTSVLHSHKLFLQESSGIEDFIGYSFAVLIF